MGDFPRELGSRSLESQNSAIVNYPSFVNYLRETVTTLLPEEDVEPALNSSLEDEDNKKCVLDFLSNPHVWTLFVQRNLMSEEDDERENVGESETPLYCISNDIEMGNPHTASLVLTKVIDAAVNPNRSIHSQLTVRLVTDDDGPPYETLHAISKIMAPSLRSYVQGTGPADRNGDKMATSVQEEEAKLEMGLINLQNIDIPEISLAIHPLVSLIMKQCVKEGRKPKVDDFGEKVEDSTFLNQLQNGVNIWIKEIQKVTKLYRDPESGTALQEIMFWLDLERALHWIQEKRKSISISLTLDILKHGKRFHATVSFDTDTSLKQALATVNDYNPLMKDFPINDLLSATELERIKVAVQQIFMHLRKIRSTKYPIQRVLHLVEAISRDLGQQLLKVLGTRRLMHIPFDEFEKVMGQCFEVFTTWDDEYTAFAGLLRDIVKKKREKHFKIVWRDSPAHKELQTRMEHMRRFRRQHEQLRTVIIRVLKPTIRQSNTNASIENAENTDVQVKFALDAAGTNIIRDVNLAYQKVMDVDCLQNITKEGLEFWDAAIDRYESEIESVDAQMAALIRDQLGRTKNANEMFRIFSRINALLYRPHISRGIREYRTQLIQHVRKDIEALHEKFKIGNSQSKYFQMIAVRDLPPVAGLIIWVKQIDSRLSIYLKRLESVLGIGWENHIEGHKLKADGDSFRKKLSTQNIFDDWAREAQQRNIGVTERIFTIDSVRSRSGRGNVLKLKANFLPEIITLAKEVRNLKNLGFRIPLAIVHKAHLVDQIYPSAISLIESTRIYERTLEKIKDKDSIIPLVAGMRKDVLSLISEGIALVWESYKLDPYIQRLSEVVVSFQEKVEDLLVVEEQLDVDVRSIETCPYSANTFADILSKIQKSVDKLSLKNYSNLHIWFARLDEEVEKNLAARLEAGIKAWTDTLMRQKNRFDLSINTDTPVQPTHKPGGDPKIQNQIHKVRITNETIHLYPSIEYARCQIMQQLVAWQAIVTSQMRLHSSTYQISLNTPEPAGTYKNLLTKLPGGEKPLEAAYEAIEAKMKDIVNYVDQWLGYQSLWDLQPDCFYGKLGDSINLWTKCLNDIKKTRAVLDALDTRRDFGSVIIDFTEAKSVIIMKHDSWYNEILGKLRSILGEEISTTDAQILQSTHDSEQQSVEIASDKAAVGFVTYVQSHSRNVRVWEKQFYVYKEGQRILERQRIQLPSTRTHVNHIEGEWRAFNDIIKHGDNDNDN